MGYSYELIRSDRKTLSLEVTRELPLRVRAPRRCAKAVIDGFVAKHAGWIEKQMERQKKRVGAAPPEPTPEEAAALKRRAKEVLPERVAYFSKIMGLAPSGIRITSAKRRFGSCSAKSSLCFSFRLMGYPEPAVDYVVVHELAHIKHKNHGSKFYALVASILPDYKERRKLLKG
jgi:predicted metal-dependent hydrolase